jgi:hypothetical protein
MVRVGEVICEAFLVTEGPMPSPRAMRVCKGDEVVDIEIGRLCGGGACVKARPLPTVYRTATRIAKHDRQRRFIDEDFGSGVLAISIRIDPLSPFVTVVDRQGGRNGSNRQERSVRRLRRRHETPRAVAANQQQADRGHKAPCVKGALSRLSARAGIVLFRAQGGDAQELTAVATPQKSTRGDKSKPEQSVHCCGVLPEPMARACPRLLIPAVASWSLSAVEH